ncbi:hypothetical protein [Burkholderia sp. Z1]|uniref:hypothetical protein n=1 Tax=Burkholderia sp. Z1 TaxID=2759039 RepID=UPI001868BCBA|nr:hypothetical protein [Burkholderia sp. Z1]
MSYWRKFILVVLLALSLPIQSFATVSMPCAGAVVPDANEMSHAMPVVQDGHPEHDSHAPSCSDCVSCCVGTSMPGAPAAPAASGTSVTIVAHPPSTVIVSFLTGGIDRPPRWIPA